jgi:hypothetical protein
MLKYGADAGTVIVWHIPNVPDGFGFVDALRLPRSITLVPSNGGGVPGVSIV